MSHEWSCGWSKHKPESQAQDKIQSHHSANGPVQAQFSELWENSAKLKLSMERALLMLLLAESHIFHVVPKHMLWK